MKLLQLAAIWNNNITTALSCLECGAYNINGTVFGDVGCFEGKVNAGEDLGSGCSTRKWTFSKERFHSVYAISRSSMGSNEFYYAYSKLIKHNSSVQTQLDFKNSEAVQIMRLADRFLTFMIRFNRTTVSIRLRQNDDITIIIYCALTSWPSISPTRSSTT